MVINSVAVTIHFGAGAAIGAAIVAVIIDGVAVAIDFCAGAAIVTVGVAVIIDGVIVTDGNRAVITLA